MSDLGPDPTEADDDEAADPDARGGKHFAGQHDDEPDVPPQPQPLPDDS